MLGISPSTVNGYLAEAIELLGARDRREAAWIAFGEGPRTGIGGTELREAAGPLDAPALTTSTTSSPAIRPWHTTRQPENAMSFLQTIGWMFMIAVGSSVVLTLAMIFANGVAPVVHAVKSSIGRQLH